MATKRRLWGPEAAAVLLALGSGACVAGRYPQAGVTRPLSMPAGEHQIVLSVGFEPRAAETNGENGNASQRDLGYRYGVTDNLDYQFPLRVAYAWTFGEHALAIAGGVAELGWSEDWAKRFRGDPRLPNTLMRAFTWSAAVSVSGKLALPTGVAVVTADASQDVFNAQARDGATGVFAAWRIEPGPRVSLALGGAARLERSWYLDDTAGVFVLGGRGSDGYAPVPLLALHASAVVDIFASVELRYQPRGRESQVTAWLGIDVHGRRR